MDGCPLDRTCPLRGAPAAAEVGSAETSASGAMITPVVYAVPEDTAPGTCISIFALDDRSLFPVHVEFEVF